jgi:hypothetical protein
VNGYQAKVTVQVGKDQNDLSLITLVRRSISFHGNGRCHLTSNSSFENRPCRLLNARQNGRQISTYEPETSNSFSPLP